MESSGFFPSDNRDRVYRSANLAAFFNKLYSNGIFDNGLAVVINEDMSVIVKEGWAMINGYWYHNDSDKILTLNPGDPLQSRIDNIVLRYNIENRIVEAMIVEGSYSDTPSPPAITRTSSIYELRLAKILVETATTELLQSMITDCRFDENDCGVVINAIQHLNTEDIFAQYQAAFDEWFATLKTELDGDVAGHLQNEINDIKEVQLVIEEISDSDLSNYTFLE